MAPAGHTIAKAMPTLTAVRGDRSSALWTAITCLVAANRFLQVLPCAQVLILLLLVGLRCNLYVKILSRALFSLSAAEIPGLPTHKTMKNRGGLWGAR